MGCCGYGFISKEKIIEAIEKNTEEFNCLGAINIDKLVLFRDRAHYSDLRDGVCRNFIMKNGKCFCPLHPSQNQGAELRLGHCDLNFLCRTAKEFAKWDLAKQNKFLNFIAQKKLDNWDYSIKMDNSSLLYEFESLQQV